METIRLKIHGLGGTINVEFTLAKDLVAKFLADLADKAQAAHRELDLLQNSGDE